MTHTQAVIEYVQQQYGAEPEHPWMRFPDYTVFRHAGNRKWFGLIMNIPKDRLEPGGSEIVDVLNVKLSDPLLVDLLAGQPGYYRGYHISRGNWVSILLDGTVPLDEICRWLDESHRVTAPKKKHSARK